MRVISIIQPWATLIALGEKRFETRSWATKYRGDLAIHASKKIDKSVCKQEPFCSVLAKHGYTADNLPTGAIIAIGSLRGCYAIGEVDHEQKKVNLPWDDRFIYGNEFDFGWYEYGRYAWEMVDVRRIEPIQAKGQLGLWNYEEGARIIKKLTKAEVE